MARRKKSPIEVNVSTRTIHLFGDIGSSATQAAMLALRDLDKTPGDIIVEISSDGGNVSDGLALYEVMRSCKNRIKTVGIGNVESIALIVYLGGEIRTAQKNIQYMDHVASVELEGSHTAAQLLSIAKSLRDMDSKSRKIMEERTKKSATWWKRKSSSGQDFTFSYKEALEYGVITEES